MKDALKPFRFTTNGRSWRPCVLFFPLLPLLSSLPLLGEFVDVSKEAGLYEAFSKPEGNPLYNHGAAFVVDIDSDGWLDFYTTRSQGGNHLHRNNGDGTFTESAAQFGLEGPTAAHGAAFADFDNDGDQDLFISTLDHPRFYLYINQGDGTFTEEAITRGAAIVVEDPLHRGYSVTVGDYDVDGWLDIHICEYFIGQIPVDSSQHSVLLRNLGASSPAHFENVTAQAGVSIDEEGTQFVFASAFADFDQDGWPDLTLTGDFQTSKFFKNNGDGTFSDLTDLVGVNKDQAGMGITVGDYDNDLQLDFFVTSIYDNPGLPQPPGYTGNRLYRYRNDRGNFDELSMQLDLRDSGFGWGASFFDKENDGDLDLIATNGIFTYGPELPETTRLWENTGQGQFLLQPDSEGIEDKRNGYGLLTWDYDNDGDQDILIAQKGEPLLLYRNDTDVPNNWIRLRLKGTVSNRDGIGTKVLVESVSNGAQQYFEYNPTNLFMAQSEPYLHIGLGDTGDSIHRISLTWPSGITQILENLPSNRRLEIVEPLNELSGIRSFNLNSLMDDGEQGERQFIAVGSQTKKAALHSNGFRFSLPSNEDPGLNVSYNGIPLSFIRSAIRFQEDATSGNLTFEISNTEPETYLIRLLGSGNQYLRLDELQGDPSITLSQIFAYDPPVMNASNDDWAELSNSSAVAEFSTTLNIESLPESSTAAALLVELNSGFYRLEMTDQTQGSEVCIEIYKTPHP